MLIQISSVRPPNFTTQACASTTPHRPTAGTGSSVTPKPVPRRSKQRVALLRVQTTSAAIYLTTVRVSRAQCPCKAVQALRSHSVVAAAESVQVVPCLDSRVGAARHGGGGGGHSPQTTLATVFSFSESSRSPARRFSQLFILLSG